ncbi:alpha/beta hydrolase [Congregibacter variabilis]|uniref:Alpha/beta hydrolase n=1 Tax=Congregibacter variabilis TaxID=3081200 RepID=A0ABZ0I9R2_9GAMM|nr:alpha/beta hydrolase [Congregibacter sp. IMCC43200]
MIWALMGVFLSLFGACGNLPDKANARAVIPYLTTRGFSENVGGEIKYSTDVGEVSGGECRVDLFDGESLEANNVSRGPRTFDEVMTGFDSNSAAGILVYVHGYNTDLERACRDAAVLAYRTGFLGRILLFSWPASTTVVTYWKDERRIAESLPAIMERLDALGERYGYDKIKIVAHSMGSRLALDAIAAPSQNQKFEDLILIAPDIDRERFIDALPVLQQRVKSISVIVSESDRLLMLSQAVNLGERLGQASDFVAAGVEVVDVSGFEDLGFGGHLYHLESDRVGEILKLILMKDPVASGH